MTAMRHSTRHRFVHWIACFAILLNALAPSVSQAIALASGQPTGWTQICSLAGLRWIAVDQDLASSQDPASPATQATEQCPFCAVHAGSFGLAPVSIILFVPTAQAIALSAIPVARDVRAPVHFHARVRAPPAPI